MVRTISVALVCSFVPAISLSQPAATQPKFKAGVTLIEVAASVRDGAGRFVPGLAPGDFELKVDGHAVPIDSFAAVNAAPVRAEEGRLVVLLFDDVATTPTLLPRMKEIGLKVVDRMAPFDEGAALVTNGDATITTGNRDELRARIRTIPPFGKLSPFQPVEHALRTIADLATQMGSAERRRKVIVIIGSVRLFDAVRPTGVERPELQQAWFDAARAAARNNVAVYIVDPRGLRATSDIAADFGPFGVPQAPAGLPSHADSADYSGASGFAGETGGLAFANTNNFDLVIDRIWSDIRNYYLLGYSVPPGTTDKAPKLSVSVKREGVEVQARRTAG